MSTALDLLEFSGSDYRLDEFIDLFRSEIPLIVITRTGIDPEDDPVHSISAEEIIWICDVKHQRRVLAVEETSGETSPRYFSIPLDYPHKFQRVRKPEYKKGLSLLDKSRAPLLASREQPKSLGDLVEEMKAFPGEKLFTLQNTEDIQVLKEGSRNTRRQISLLKYVDEYEQRYLIGHPIVKDGIGAMTTSIPIYLDILVGVATGIRMQDKTAFDQWMKEVNEIGFSLRENQGCTSQAIIEFQEMPDCCEYDYIRPYSYLKTEEKLKHEDNIQTIGDQANIYDHGKSTSSTATKKSTPVASQPPPPIPPRSPRRPTSKKLPTIPAPKTGKAPVLPPIYKNSEPEAGITTPKPCTSIIPETIASATADDDDNDDIHDYEIIDECAANSPNVKVKLTDYRSIADVPADIEVSELSVAEVAHSLVLLGLPSRADTVRNRFIDGEIASELSEDTLVGSLEFSKFEARQFVKFLSGWRPNLK